MEISNKEYVLLVRPNAKFTAGIDWLDNYGGTISDGKRLSKFWTTLANTKVDEPDAWKQAVERLQYVKNLQNIVLKAKSKLTPIEFQSIVMAATEEFEFMKEL